MKKAILSFVIPLAMFSFAVAFIKPANVEAQTVMCPVGYTCTPIVQTLPVCPTGYICTPINSNDQFKLTSGSINLASSAVGLISDTGTTKSYQVNLSFLGGTNARPISNWSLTLNCPSGMDANTSPGTSCNSAFQMGTNGQNNGNVTDKAFWFKNYNSTSQSVTAILKGYDSANNLMGTAQQTILVPSTGSGQQTWSQVTVLTPNGGQTFTIGQSILVQWKTTTGDFQYLSTSRTKIYLMRDRSVVATYDNLPNNGSVVLPIRSDITPGNNYKISVTVYAENTYAGTAQSDESDDYFTIVKSSGNASVTDGSNSNPVINSSSGYRPSGTQATGAVLSTSLTSTNEDKVGSWEKFGPGKAYVNQNPADFGFTANLTLSQTVRTIKAITIFYDYYGQGCSTSRDMSTFGVDPYPMVVFKDGAQQNSSYDVALGTYQPGNYSLKLYCQPESTPFNGGKILITFTDGTYVTTTIDASMVTTPYYSPTPSPTPYYSPTPSPTPYSSPTLVSYSSVNSMMTSSAQPAIKIVSPTAGQTLHNVDLGVVVVWTNNFKMTNPSVSLKNSANVRAFESKVSGRMYPAGMNYDVMMLDDKTFPSGLYKIEVCENGLNSTVAASGKVCGANDSYFSITTSVPLPNATPTPTPYSSPTVR